MMVFRATLTACLLALGGLVACGGPTAPPPVTPYAAGINDSGRGGCADATQAQVPCAAAPSGQDAEFGRDAAQRKGELNKLGRGDQGFDFSRLGADAMPLLVQTGAWSAGGSAAAGTYWECALDHATGLTWEVKHGSPSHPRWVGSTYSWHDSNTLENGGFAGTAGAGTCSAGTCDTQGYVAYVNGIALCGYSDWRVPAVGELLSIAHHGRENPAIDLFAFPNASSEFLRYWTADTVAEIPQIAWYVYFSDGSVSFTQKSNASYLRLVRSDSD